MDQSQPSYDQARTKLIQIFRYVQAFNRLQNPIPQDIQSQPWTLWFHDLPDHPCIRLSIGGEASTQIGSTQPSPVSPDGSDSEHTFILKVSRPKLTEPPDPPEEIERWLLHGWQEVDGTVTIDPQRAAELNANSRLQYRFEEWKGRRNKWADMERPNRKAMQIFDQLYSLRARLEREAEKLELMIGDGLLNWYPGNSEGVHHPVLLLRLQLLFNPQIPEFTLSETEQPPELYTALFQTLPEVNALDIGRSRQDFEQSHWHPLGGDDTSHFLRRLVNQLSPKGEFSVQKLIQRDKSLPLITRDPVLFLRNRTLGFNTALESILEVLPLSDHLPHSLTSLVGIESQVNAKQGTHDSRSSMLTSPNGEDEQILLSKPANAEQLEVARRLEQYGAVLVQGPPGTGKTHTIANLIGHLLAEGKSVLVTSHTSKALKVLQEKVVPPLQPLCVSILEDDSRKQMESAIDAITERLAFSRPEALEREAVNLTQQRLDILSQLRKTRIELKEARNNEYQALILAGQQYTPADAARYIAHHQADAGWLPGPVVADTPLPLSLEEAVDLYRTNDTVKARDEREMVPGLPDIHSFLPPSEFAHIIAEQGQLQKEDLTYRCDLWYATNEPDSLEETFEALHLQLVRALEPLQHSTRWQLAAVSASCKGGPHRHIWDDLIGKIEGVFKLGTEAQRLLIEYNPFIPEHCLPDQIEKVLNEIMAYLDHHEKLNNFILLIHRDWKTLIDCTKVKGQAPERREHFAVLHTLLQLQSAREDLLGRWQRQMVPLDAPATTLLGPNLEQYCIQFVSPLRQCLEWYSMVWGPLEHKLKQSGLYWDKLKIEAPINLAEHGDLFRLNHTVQVLLPPVLAAESKRRIYARHEAKLQALLQQVQLIGGAAAQATIVQQLRHALTKRLAPEYGEAFKRLANLQNQQHELHCRYTLLTKLEKKAPGWAAAIRHREGIHGQREVPRNIEDAWLWRQLNDELERRSKVSLEELQERITRLSNHLQMITAELVEKKAWAAQLRRTTLEQRQALQGWKEIMRKVGRGTGKRAPRLLAEARNLMPICQTAVPVWIMPLSRVVQNFDPRRNRFDVVIIDEASQADITSLVAIYMGQQVVVVGDHEQVTPMAVGQKLDDVEKIIDEHLQGIRNAAIYDGRLSIYSLAQTAFEPICLREHFRCVSPIIQFSNALSYDGKIKPLRDDSEVKRRPPTVAYRVKSSGLTGSVNEEEAQAIASLLVAAAEQPEYQDATFGVISMVKDEQALRIDTLLQKHLPPKEYARRQVLCGNAAQFQGDERDVIFLSMVDTPRDDGPLSLRSEDAYDYMYKKRFNVAASRARDQLWVVHSLNFDTDLKDGDIRKRLIRHALNPHAFAYQITANEKRTESEFELQVMKRLMQTGYRVIPQWAVGSYRIDLVVEGAGKRLAVECDGDRWHTAENLEADMARQAILERLGWRFVRIRGSEFFRNPDKAMQLIFSRLRDLEIPAEGMDTTPPPDDTNEHLLRKTIVRYAAELRQEWAQQSGKLTKIH